MATTRAAEIIARFNKSIDDGSFKASSFENIISTTQKKRNPVPEDGSGIKYFMVELKTTDNTNSAKKTEIPESYVVTETNFTAIKLAQSGGERRFLAFGSSPYGMKFHYPDGVNNLNKIYITMCVKDKNYTDGIRDYVTVVSKEWISAAIAYCMKLPVNSTRTTSSVKVYPAEIYKQKNTKKLNFSFKGSGASSDSKSQGVASFDLNFVEAETVVDTGAPSVGTAGPGTINTVLTPVAPIATVSDLIKKIRQ